MPERRLTTPYVIALHGGAGVMPGRDYSRAEAFLKRLATQCATELAAGASALDTVERAVMALEGSGLYVAGRGSAPNTDGVVELDASIMDGASGRGGAVCAVRDVVHPVRAARRVMDATPHVMLAGAGATAFAHAQNLETVDDPGRYYVVPDGVTAADMTNLDGGKAVHGTVGAVALDRSGRLAAATSTGGTFGKRPGRVGDTPLIGPGSWADGEVAISSTGVGEAFILSGGAGDVAARMRYGGQAMKPACEAMLDQVKRHGGDGGVIAINKAGEAVFAWNSGGMKRAAAGSDLPLMAATR